jgi:transposase
VRTNTLLLALLGLKHSRINSFELTQTELVVDVAPRTRRAFCSGCGRRCRHGYDARERRWRHLEIIGLRVQLRYRLRRVECRRCGVRSELVPWAEPDSGFTRAFEQQVAYLAQRTDKTTVCSVMDIAWETVGRIVQRVVARLGPTDRLAGLRRIAIDELSYRRHHEYVTIVTDHDTGRIVWAAKGKSADTLRAFFDALGSERSALLELVTIDMSQAYIEVVRERAPKATLVFDRFHVQRLVQNALDEVRRAQVREVAGTPAAKAIKKTRYALQKNPWNLTQPEKERLAQVQRRNRPLFRGYLLKETFASILDGAQVNVARDKLTDWVGWASRSKLPPFKKVAATVTKYSEGILGYVATGMSNGRAEGMNGKVRTITRRAYGFHSASALISLLFLCCSGLVLEPLRRLPGDFIT